MRWTFEGALIEHVRKSAHIYRQISATVATALLFLSGGINMGFTAVLFSQLKADENFPYDETLDSWIASLIALAMTIGALCGGTISDWFGRRSSQMMLSGTYIIGWIIMGFSYNNTMLLIARFITGFAFGATISSGMVFITELADPKYRAMALIFPSLSIHIGNLVSHTVGKYVYWKHSCFIFITPNVINLILLTFLKESPLWLLYKNRINEGRKSFIMYRGNTETSQKELELAIQQSNKTEKQSFMETLKGIFSKPFMKTLLTIFFLFIASQGCGVNTIPYYAEDIFQMIFCGDIDAFLLMIVTDCVRIICNIAICIITKLFPQRIILLASCLLTCIALTATAVYLYLSPTGLLWVAVTFVLIYTGTGTAVSSISYSIMAELFPSNIRGLGYGLGTAISCGLQFISVKVTPVIIIIFGEVSLFGSFAILTFVGCTFLILLVPNTNRRTLQDIEESLYSNK